MPIPFLIAAGIASALGAAGSGIGGAIGGIHASEEERKRMEILKQMLDEYGDDIDPEAIRELTAEQSGRSEMDGVHADTGSVDSQLRALKGMEESYNTGGMDAQSLAQLNQVQNQVSQDDRSRREALVARNARQGRGTGGAAYSSLLQGTQNAAQANSQGAFDAHAAARMRALQSMGDAGRMASGMRDQGFSEGAMRAQANDKIGMFNTQLRQQANIQNQQRDAQVFGQKMQKANARNDARGQMAQAHGDAAQRHREQGYGYGKMIGSAVGSVAGRFGG